MIQIYSDENGWMDCVQSVFLIMQMQLLMIANNINIGNRERIEQDNNQIRENSLLINKTINGTKCYEKKILVLCQLLDQ